MSRDLQPTPDAERADARFYVLDAAALAEERAALSRDAEDDEDAVCWICGGCLATVTRPSAERPAGWLITYERTRCPACAGATP